jgi:hypothetical protein
MKRLASVAIALCALGMAGCSGNVSKPYTAHANLEMYDPPPRVGKPSFSSAQTSRVEPVAQAIQVDSAPETVGSASAAPPAESIEVRRQRQIREDTARDERMAQHLRDVTQICRC